MSSKANQEWERKYQNRFRKIREAAAAAIRELNLLRSAGPVSEETLETEVARIAQEKLRPVGCDLVLHRTNGVTRFLIKVQKTGRRYDLIKSFFHREDDSRFDSRA
jgi:hypothetical protein